MESKMKSIIRVVIAGVVVLTGVAGLNSVTAQAASPSGVSTMMSGPNVPTPPPCTPQNGCQLPW